MAQVVGDAFLILAKALAETLALFSFFARGVVELALANVKFECVAFLHASPDQR